MCLKEKDLEACNMQNRNNDESTEPHPIQYFIYEGLAILEF